MPLLEVEIVLAPGEALPLDLASSLAETVSLILFIYPALKEERPLAAT